MKEYTQYYFAFIDLLGFKEIVNTKTCNEIYEIFEEVKSKYYPQKGINESEYAPIIPPDDIHYYIMSDSICIFIKSDIKSALTVLTWICLYLQVRLLCLKTPIFVRGSIALGNVYSDNNILYGPAMVEAYLRSEEIAQYPRIVIPKRLINEVDNLDEKRFLNISTFLEADDLYVINYLEFFCLHQSSPEQKKNVINFITNILDTSLNKSVREKYSYVKYWMDQYLKKQENENEKQLEKDNLNGEE